MEGLQLVLPVRGRGWVEEVREHAGSRPNRADKGRRVRVVDPQGQLVAVIKRSVLASRLRVGNARVGDHHVVLPVLRFEVGNEPGKLGKANWVIGEVKVAAHGINVVLQTNKP